MKFVLSLVEIHCMVIKICILHCNSLYSGKITPAWAEKKGQTGKGLMIVLTFLDWVW